jgi:hypothetical protein
MFEKMIHYDTKNLAADDLYRVLGNKKKRRNESLPFSSKT